MEKLKSSLLNMSVILTGVAIITGGILAVVNAVTAPQIEKIEKETLAAGIQKVMGGEEMTVGAPDTIKQTIDNKEKTFIIYKVSDKEGTVIGHAVQSSENGFGGELKVLTGFSQDGIILGYTILQSAETPGLGAKASTWFQKESGEKRSVVGKNLDQCNFTVSKDGGDIDAITASTITSRAFLKAIQNAYNQISGKCVDEDATSGATSHDATSGASQQEDR